MRPLFEHQKRGVKLLAGHRQFGLFWDCGVGKSYTVLSALKELDMPGVIVCPESAKLTWLEENEITNCDLELYNYSNLSKIGDLTGKALIFDEAHYLKNYKSKRTTSALQIVNQFNPEKLILLTGTPIADKPIDLFMLLVFLQRRSIDEFYKFRATYANMIRKKIGWNRFFNKPKYAMEIIGFKNLERLREELSDVSDYLKLNQVFDLPPATFIPIYYDMTREEKREYGETKDHIMAELAFCSKMSTSRAIEQINKILEESEGKVVVYSNFIETVKMLEQELNCPVLLGEDGISVRKGMLNSFNNSHRILASTYKTGAESLNLQTANYEVLVDLPMYLLELVQALKRIYRTGQTKKTFYYILIPRKTTLEKVFKFLNKKFNFVGAVFPENLEFDIMSLFKELSNEPG